LHYEKCIFLKSVKIYETYHPGSVVGLFAFNYRVDKWVKIWSIFEEGFFKTNYEALNRQLPSKRSRKFVINIEKDDVYSE
jgi:hypothetical protein